MDQGVYFDNVSMVARRLRAGLGPRVKLAINIGKCSRSEPLPLRLLSKHQRRAAAVPRDCTLWPSGCHGNGWPQYTHVPPELDLLSFDGYNWTNGTACAPPRCRRVPTVLSETCA